MANSMQPAGDADRGGLIDLQVSMSTELFAMLAGLAGASGEPIGRVVAKALLLYRAAADARRAGKAVGVAATADALETEFVGI